MSALEGLRVLDFSRLLPGPYCTWLLSELGATVTRIENPREVAKQAKVFGWDRLDERARERMRAQDMLARNKRSLALDIGHASARDIILRLTQAADVVVEDYRPGVLDGLGLGYGDLSAARPELVYCSITLCGRTGPYRDRPGHDPLAMAISGAMSRAGDREERPSSLGLAVADVLTGTNAALAILAAVTEARRTGRGRHLDIAMSDAAMCLNANVLSRHPDPATIPPRGQRRADSGIWRTKDGGFIATSDMEPRYWERFCAVAGHPEWVPLQLDATARLAIAAEIARLFETRTRAEWEAILTQAGTQFAPVLSVTEALEDPHNRARGMVRTLEGPDGPIAQLSQPLDKALGRDMPDRAAVLPGHDRDEILCQAGFSEDEIRELISEGALPG